jgi:hypothetical protein
MALTFKFCPKCGHVRRPGETDAPERCPACGLFFAKWATRSSFKPTRSDDAGSEETVSTWRTALLGGLRERLAHVPENAGALHVYSRAAMLILFTVWGVRIALMDYQTGEIGASFMHAILLPSHEAGHIFLIPFGHFLTILGGSLFQVVFPLIVGCAVLWQNRDPFGAALGVWWCGASLVDLAPYIYDAKNPQLVLLGGSTGEDGPHDWIYLLGVFGKISQSQGYGFLVHKLGVLVMALALVWAGKVLWRMHRQRSGK